MKAKCPKDAVAISFLVWHDKPVATVGSLLASQTYPVAAVVEAAVAIGEVTEVVVGMIAVAAAIVREAKKKKKNSSTHSFLDSVHPLVVLG